LDRFDIRVSDIPFERGRNSNDRNAIIGAAFDPKVLSRARRLYVPPALVAILLEDLLKTLHTCPQWDDEQAHCHLVGAIEGTIADDYVEVILALAWDTPRAGKRCSLEWLSSPERSMAVPP
jgi:hypothetical protein